MEHHHEHHNHVQGQVHEQHTRGHAMHDHGKMITDFRRRFFIVLLLTIPIMLLSEMIQHWAHIHISFAGSNYVLFVLSAIVFFYGGYPFLAGLSLK